MPLRLAICITRLAPGGGCMLREGKMSDGVEGIDRDAGEGLSNMSHGMALVQGEKDATCKPAE